MLHIQKNEFYRQRGKRFDCWFAFTHYLLAADLSPSGPLRPNATMGVDDINTGATVSSLAQAI